MITYIVWDVSPEIFGGFFFRWYGVCWLAGMIVAYAIMLHIFKSEGIRLVELDTLTTFFVFAIITGARFGHILFYDPVYYWNNPIEILPFRIKPDFEFTGLTGLASHGGVIGALLALYFYQRKFGRSYWWLADRITIAGAALGGFIRLGNLMNSEIIGTPSTMPWSFIFSRVDQVPRHPSQLYEALFYFGVSIALFLLWRSKKYYNHHGFISGLGVTVVFAQRFLMEFLKENQSSFEEHLVLNMGQWLSIPFILGGITLIAWRLNPTKKTTNN